MGEVNPDLFVTYYRGYRLPDDINYVSATHGFAAGVDAVLADIMDPEDKDHPAPESAQPTGLFGASDGGETRYLLRSSGIHHLKHVRFDDTVYWRNQTYLGSDWKPSDLVDVDGFDARWWAARTGVPQDPKDRALTADEYQERYA